MIFLFSPIGSLCVWLCIFCIAIIVHEYAHAYIAYRLGDPTPQFDKRITLNPRSHINPWGIVLFLIAGVGRGKPVRIQPHYFRRPNIDIALIAIAGPIANLLYACISMAIGYSLLRLGGSIEPLVIIKNMSPLHFASLVHDIPGAGWIQPIVYILALQTQFNILLAIFNLLPIPPLDGGRILALIFPYTRALYHRYALIIHSIVLVTLVIIRTPLLGWLSTATDNIMRALIALLSFIFS